MVNRESILFEHFVGMLTGGESEDHFVSQLYKTLNGSLGILDIGTSQRFAKELRPYESVFMGKTTLLQDVRRLRVSAVTIVTVTRTSRA
jgi:hypothetical protein